MTPVATGPLALCLAGIAISRAWGGEAGIQAGVAELDITPPVGYRMAGYFDERLATGTHDPLKAKAIILQQGPEKFAFAFCDLVGVSLHVTTNARARFSAGTGIPVSHILIAATHSHTGPLFDDVRRDYFREKAIAATGRDPHESYDYAEFLTERLVKVLHEAVARLAPANLSAGVTQRPGLAFNRRYHMKNGSVTFNPGRLNPNIIAPAGPVDPDVGILWVQRPEAAQPEAALTVFACHLDTVGGTEFSADYAFYLQEALRHEFGAPFLSAFGIGTCGDINHINTGIKDDLKGFPMAQWIGTNLADAVLKARRGLSPIAKPAFAMESRTLSLPLQEVTPEQVAAARRKMKMLEPGESGGFMEKVEAVKAVELGARNKTWPVEVQVFRLDADTAIVGLPGEIFCDFGLAIKKASGFKRTLVLSLCNDRPGYVPTEQAFHEGSYEVTNSRLKPGGGEVMIQTSIELLAKLKKTTNESSPTGIP